LEVREVELLVGAAFLLLVITLVLFLSAGSLLAVSIMKRKEKERAAQGKPVQGSQEHKAA
jgi:hypothetical protein